MMGWTQKPQNMLHRLPENSVGAVFGFVGTYLTRILLMDFSKIIQEGAFSLFYGAVGALGGLIVTHFYNKYKNKQKNG